MALFENNTLNERKYWKFELVEVRKTIRISILSKHYNNAIFIDRVTNDIDQIFAMLRINQLQIAKA